MDEKGLRFRHAFIIILILFAVIFFFVVRIQIIEGRRYYQLSEENRVREVYNAAPRGSILDRNGIILANSRPGFSVSIIPAVIDDRTTDELAVIVGMDPAAIRERMKRTRTPRIALKIKHDIDFNTLTKVEERMREKKGIVVGIEPLRNYPHDSLFCHVLGYVGEVTYGELGGPSEYRYGDFVGRMGIEEFYEGKLRGKDGVTYMEVDAYGNELGPIAEKRPLPLTEGESITLTIDAALQESAAVYLAAYKKAAVVALDPGTGDVLTLYSKPGFDPNVFIQGLTMEAWREIEGHQDAPLYDRAIMSGYPPGSTYKPFVALAALDQGLVKADRKFAPCTGKFRMGNRVFRCWSVHRRKDLVEALVHSCDIYFYQLGLLVGIDGMHELGKRLGLGEVCGIDLPEEKKGLLPDTKWFDVRYRKQWSKGHVMNLAIGQGEILVTPLQLACAYAVLANEGKAVHPRLMKHGKPKLTETGISKEAIATVRQSLLKVVEEGTGVMARLGPMPIAGKTGTAQNPFGGDHSLFVGYSPVDHPEILVVVIVENAGHGGSIAAPIAGRLIEDFFNKHGPRSR